MSAKQAKKFRKLYSKSMTQKAWNDVKIIYARYKKMQKKEMIKTILLCISITANIILIIFIFLGR